MESVKLEVQRMVREKVGLEAYLQLEIKFPKAYRDWMEVVDVLLGDMMNENEIILLRRDICTELKELIQK